jgi:hypothetical protein
MDPERLGEPAHDLVPGRLTLPSNPGHAREPPTEREQAMSELEGRARPLPPCHSSLARAISESVGHEGRGLDRRTRTAPTAMNRRRHPQYNSPASKSNATITRRFYCRISGVIVSPPVAAGPSRTTRDRASRPRPRSSRRAAHARPATRRRLPRGRVPVGFPAPHCSRAFCELNA